MYHSVIGKRLVAAVNRRDSQNYSAREFFDKVYVPLFFGSVRLLQYVNNSPFDQAISKRKKPFSDALLAECLATVHGKVAASVPDASFFLGGPAAGVAETTSGQVTDMRIPIPDEDVYASWIGAALGLTVQGGLTVLVDDDDVVLATYDGWRRYRELLDQTPKLKPLQINAWNAQWLVGTFEEKRDFYPTASKDGSALETESWVRTLFCLGAHFRGGPHKRLIAYVYSLGQSNTTVGFVRLNLTDPEGLYDLYQRLFTVPAGMAHATFAALYETERGFRSACAQTEVGLKALKPRDVFRAQSEIPKVPKPDETEKTVSFDIYQTWIIAMLKNEELNSRARATAAAFVQLHRHGARGKSVHSQHVETALKAKNRREFIEAVTELVAENTGLNAELDLLVDDMVAMPQDQVPLFITLLRFKFAIENSR